MIQMAACPTMNAATYSAAVADVAIVLMITLRKPRGAFCASLSAQSPKIENYLARDLASDSLR